MREIKFRAWDTSRKSMWSAEEMGMDQLTINPDGRGFINVHGKSTKMSQYMSHLTPLQYTGLLDKNGKEIYDGDVIDGHPHVDKYVIVYWDDGLCGWEVRSADKITFSHLLDYSGEADLGYQPLEVIGNIWENPELLKEANNG